MDLIVVLLLLLQLLAFTWIQEIQAFWYPKNKYSMSLTSKDTKEDIKRRRKHARRSQPISLKPPPQDWPEPAMGAGDFIVEDQSQPPTLSPLLAYQAKLEQEYIRQQQKEAQKIKEINTQELDKHSVWTSSEEDLKKLLDPNELVKHNKQLKPLVSQGRPLKSIIKKIISEDQLMETFKTSTDQSVTKRSITSNKKRKRKSSMSVSTVTTEFPAKKRRRKKIEKVAQVDQSKSLKKRRKRKSKSAASAENEVLRTSKRKKKIRKFAFAHKNYQNIEEEVTTTKTKRSKMSEIETLEEVGVSSTINKIVTSDSPQLQGIPQMTTPQTNEQSSKKTSLQMTKLTSKLPSINTGVGTNQVYESNIFNRSKEAPEDSKITTSVSNYRRKNEIREKRKEIRKEMGKVLEAEQLKGSFEDRDSNWSTSEENFYVEYNEIQNAMKRKVEALKRSRTTVQPKNKTKISIANVTPRHAVLGIIKQTIINFIDRVLKKSSLYD